MLQASDLAYHWAPLLRKVKKKKITSSLFFQQLLIFNHRLPQHKKQTMQFKVMSNEPQQKVNFCLELQGNPNMVVAKGKVKIWGGAK